jgi:hypothetical protein
MSTRIDFVAVVAREKLGVSDDWLWFGWERVGDDALIVRGGVPIGTVSRGPRKGRPKWKMPGDRVVVTDAEQRAARARYEAATGLCSECQGAKEAWAGWSAEHGNRYRPCPRCGATGQAPAVMGGAA